jgi:hypothetical protein
MMALAFHEFLEHSRSCAEVICFMLPNSFQLIAAGPRCNRTAYYSKIWPRLQGIARFAPLAAPFFRPEDSSLYKTRRLCDEIRIDKPAAVQANQSQKEATVMTFTPRFPRFLHGGDYNPDQWLASPEVLDKDIELMHAAHVNCVSVGIFSWTLLEPEEGRYDFVWLDEVIGPAVGGRDPRDPATPSGARPAWMAAEHPEVLGWTSSCGGIISASGTITA